MIEISFYSGLDVSRWTNAGELRFLGPRLPFPSRHNFKTRIALLQGRAAGDGPISSVARDEIRAWVSSKQHRCSALGSDTFDRVAGDHAVGNADSRGPSTRRCGQYSRSVADGPTLRECQVNVASTRLLRD